MIRNILNTVFVRVFNAAITLIIVIINSNVIGAEGMGTVSLIILAVSIFILITGFVSGALVYFVPRENNFYLVFISWSWTIISFVLFFIFMLYVPIVPEKYIIHVSALSLIFAGSNIHEKILTGKEKITSVNIIALVRVLLLIISLSVLYFYFHQKSVISYIYSLYISYSSGFLFSVFFVKKYINPEKPKNIFPLFKRVIKLSSYNAFGNIVQKLNYRLSYYLIEYFLGIKALGQFSVAVQISESTLIISRSIAFVHYSKISNLKNKLKSIKITKSLIKLTFIISALIIFVLSVIPSGTYSFVFGKEFPKINSNILSLSFGIVFLSVTMIFSSYFAGIGKHYYNTYSSLAGFFITVLLGFILIPEFKLLGAGLTASFSYTSSLLFQFFLMKKHEKIKIQDLFIKKEDIKLFKDVVFSGILKPHKQNNGT